MNKFTNSFGMDLPSEPDLIELVGYFNDEIYPLFGGDSRLALDLMIITKTLEVATTKLLM